VIGKVSASAKLLVFTANILLRVLSLLPVQKGKVVYWARGFNLYGNAYALCIKWREKKNTSHIYLLGQRSKKYGVLSGVVYIPYRSIRAIFHLATCSYLVRETDVASPPLYVRPETRVVQLWHAAGAFKKFGLDIKNRSDDLIKYRITDAERWDILLCSSECVKGIFANAFHIDERKIYIDGLPRNDLLFHSVGQEFKIKSKLGLSTNKKIILYAPTFRDDHSGNKIFKEVIYTMQEELSDGYEVCVRLHPSSSSAFTLPIGVVDCSSYDSVEELLTVTDILVTDYSSIIFDFSCLRRPMFFYVPDLSSYIKDRDFYFEYENFVPGLIAYAPSTLIDGIKKSNFCEWRKKIIKFQEEFNPYFDGNASARIIDKIVN